MKKLISLLLCALLVISLVPSQAFAASTTLVRENELAEDLKQLGLFKGVSETDFALGRAPTRTEALVMLIRVLGKEKDALSKGGRHPFLDVPSWADKYVGYAYENKLTNGVSATKFGGSADASASQYLTFVLRALGYSDSNGDFTWDNPFALAREVGIMRGNPNSLNFLRADVVLVSYAALEAQIKGTEQTLAEKLIAAGAFTAETYATHYNVSEFENEDSVTKTYSSEDIYKLCAPAVFYVATYDEEGEQTGSGSGFFIDSDGTAVTNYHVIKDISSAEIYTTRKSWYDVVGVYDYDIEQDWAVIKVDIKESPYLELSTEAVKGGEQVFAIGSPRGLDNTISEGLVSNTERVIGKQKFIQISAPISPGSSGGALINKSGKVVGITSAGISDAQNLNLAIPISSINGFTKKRATPFSAIGEFENEMPLGNINISGLSKGAAAETLLNALVYNYSNTTFSGNPALTSYEDTVKSEGYGFTYSIMLDKDEDKLYAICVYVSPKSETAMAMVDISCETYETEIYYHYDGTANKGPVATGIAHNPKAHLNRDDFIGFEEYSGMSYYDYTDHGDLALELSCRALEFTHTIMISKLTPYGVTGIADLGFTTLIEE